MPTATGRLTADEKRDADRIRQRAARLAVTAAVTTPEWIAETADAFVESLAHHRAGQAAGTIKGYDTFEVGFPAGAEHVVGRVKVDEGQARAYGVADELDRRGIPHHIMQSFGLFAGRGSVQYIIRAR